MGRLKRAALASVFGLAIASAGAYGLYMKKPAPKPAVLMHEESCDRRIARFLEEKRKSEQRLSSYSEKAEKIARLYQQSLGAEHPVWVDYEKITEILKLRMISEQIRNGKLLERDPQKNEIEKNFIQVNGGSGLLLTSDGYFITAHHVIANRSKINVMYNSMTKTARPVCWYKEFDAALCKMDMGEGQEFKVADIRLAHKIRVGEYIEVLGQVNGKLYRQVGRVLDVDATTSVGKGECGGKPSIFQSTMVISAFVEPGFSGGPVFLKQSGELAGFTSYTAEDHSYSGVARFDHFGNLIEECLKLKIKDLQETLQPPLRKDSQPDTCGK